MATGSKRKASNELALFPVNFPAGTIIPFAGGTAPEGWAICDGSTVSRSTYVALYSALGDAWGNGDGSTTFHLPDLRGRFLRGVDDPTGVDPAGRDPDAGSRGVSNAGGNSGDAVGSVQDDALGNHDHTIPVVQSASDGTGAIRTTAASDNSTRTSGIAGSSTETRPKNAAVNYIIKL